MGITPFFREFGGGHHKNFYGFFTWDFFFWVASRVFSRIFFFRSGGDAKKPPKKNFFSQVQAGFPLIFMENFSKTVKICPKRGQKFRAKKPLHFT